MALIRVQLPGTGVMATYASQQERDRSLLLAKARREVAGVTCPAWTELSEGDREVAALEARNWLRAALGAGLACTANCEDRRVH